MSGSGSVGRSVDDILTNSFNVLIWAAILSLFAWRRRQYTRNTCANKYWNMKLWNYHFILSLSFYSFHRRTSTDSVNSTQWAQVLISSDSYHLRRYVFLGTNNPALWLKWLSNGVVYSPESPPNVETHRVQPEEGGQKEEMHADGWKRDKRKIIIILNSKYHEFKNGVSYSGQL